MTRLRPELLDELLADHEAIATENATYVSTGASAHAQLGSPRTCYQQ